jgi:hypothetical protein
VVRIHRQALTTLVSSGGPSRTRAGIIKRARAFFAEAMVPIERTHRAALKVDAHERQLNQTLRQRSVDLKKEMASTQGLVRQSVRTISRFAHEFGPRHRT